ncbi:MAG TPA: hypothetical protein ENO00_12840 [Deltaproteobacteria bacterium]|nr:hypothetical protein [Deltaproteobacteria bacterium]
MISFVCTTDDPVSRYGIDHFIRTSGLSVLPPGTTDAGICVGYQAEGCGRFSVAIDQNPAIELQAGTIATQHQEYPLFQVPVDTHDSGNRCMAEFRSGSRKYPCISGSGSGISIGFDIFRLTGSLLSGHLDATGTTPDGEQHTPLVSTPLVDFYEDVLFRALLTGCGEIGMPLVRKSHWPSGKKFAVCLTHDVDECTKTYQWVTRPLRYLRRGDIPGLKNQVKSFSRRMSGHEPYWTFDDILEKEKNLGVCSTYFFLKESGERSLLKPASWHLYGRCHSLKEPRIIQLIRKLAEDGHEVGVHGSTFSYENPTLLNAEKTELEELLGTKVTGIRQHRLNLTIPDTWVHQSNAGFLYDTSLGYKAADGTGFRWGTCFPFHPRGEEGELPLLEIPLSLMDITLRDGTDGWDTCSTMIEQVRNVGGVLTLLWHPAVFNPLEYPGLGGWYWKIIKACKEYDAWVTTGQHIASWWQVREATAYDYLYDDGKLSVSCNGRAATSFDVYVPKSCSAELTSGNAALSRGEDGHYVLSPETGNIPPVMVVELRWM